MIRVRNIFTFTVFLLLLSQTAFTQGNETDYRSDAGVRLPVENIVLSGEYQSDNPSLSIPDGATVLRDPVTGMLHRVIGGNMRIDGYERITEENIHAAAQAFLHQYRASIGITADRLKLQRVTRVSDRWYVTWTQIHDGREVLLSEVELRLHSNGRVTAFGSDVYPDIALNDTPLITASDAWAAATEGLEAEQSFRKAAISVPVILPVKSRSGVEYHLVYTVPVTETVGHRWLSHVDAMDGTLLWRRPMSFGVGTEGSVYGGVTLMHPHEQQLTDLPFADMYVQVDGQRYTTNSEGTFEADISSEANVEATFEGPWCKVDLEDHDEGSFSGSMQPDTPFGLEWTDGNSHKFERILFYHTNANHRYLKSIDPELTAMDFQTLVTVEFGGDQPNAMSSGDEVQFLAVGDESMRMAAAPMVLYHELGHSLNIKLYEQLGISGGMQNRACQEGTADLHAAVITDYPKMGTGVFAEDELRVMRDLENDMVYPDSLTGESHYDGQVLSGAFWDLRKATSLDLVRRLSHFAKYGLPDDPNDGIAFAEWFIETLIADDDDGDLSNGTPHAEEIALAFGRHEIGPGLFMKSHFRHIPVVDTDDTLNPYQVQFVLQTLAISGAEVRDVHVLYSLNGQSERTRLEVAPTGTGELKALIPPQQRGTIVTYEIVAIEGLTGNTVRFLSDAETGQPYQFLVGFEDFFVDPFEEDRGWTVGSDDDSATQGTWERDNPEGIDMTQFGGPLLQLADDHTDNGTMCYATGVRGGFSFMENLPNGRTTLTSPLFDLSDERTPVLRAWYFFTNLSNPTAPDAGSGRFDIQLSNDGGTSWMSAYATENATGGWTKVLLRLEDYVTLSDAVLVRFVMDAPSSSGMLDVLTNAMIDDFAILTVSDGTVSPVRPDATLPSGIAIRGNYPNPVDASTDIMFALTSSEAVQLDIHDMLGRKVARLLQAEMSAGEHTVRWSRSSSSGVRVPSGTYIIRLTTSHEVTTRKLIVR
ncbi:MAG: hypothetical protein C0600_09390 [Ignavibacteria bacterium]|nr:MAG: hypothetical protein C0600_09390 [Ignavibacteria bacterium]